MLSGVGPNRCRVDWAMANVEPSGPMSSRPGSDRCLFFQDRVDVKWSGPGSMSSQLGPG